MNWLTNLKIGTRLGAAYAATLTLMVVVAGVGYASLRASDGYLSDIVHDNLEKTALLHDMSEQVHVVSRVLRTVVLLHSEERIATEQRKLDMARAAYDKAYEALRKMPDSEAAQAVLAKIDGARREARSTNDQVLALARANKDSEAVALLLEQAAPRVNAWQEAMDEGVALQRKYTAEAYSAAHAADQRAKVLLGSLTVVAILLSVWAAWIITRSITGPISFCVEAAERIRDGDLSQAVEVTGRDETGQLLAAMRDMQASLAKVVGQVRGNAESVATASAQIAQGNSDLSQRTEQQASSLQQTAATMEELGSTARNNTDSARQASQLAQSASRVAVQGGDVVAQVVQTMKGISESSRKIAEIIGTVDGIAFQTNILALNAAVEAARAGEQGRGFAVVASEVRTLAKRSADAAREIKSLIDASAERVERGSLLVGEAGRTMAELVASVQRVSDIVGEISSASVEQNSGVQQVGQAVTQLDQVTQQNAALVEESAAAAESLRHQAAALAQAVGVFRLVHTGQEG